MAPPFPCANAPLYLRTNQGFLMLRARSLLSGLASAVALMCTYGCSNGPIDPIELIATDIVPDAERPELSRLADGTVAQRYIVILRNELLIDGSAPGVISELALAHDVRMERVYTTALSGFAAALSDTQRAALEARPDVEAVVADARVAAIDAPGEPDASAGRPAPAPAPTPASDWALVDLFGTIDWATRAFLTSDGGTGATVAVLDTGIDTDHPSLPSAGCIGDFTTTPVGSSCEDGNGHGTHVAGTITAFASTGHRGVAPNVTLSSAKVLNAAGSGSTAGIAAAIDAAAAAGIDVLNLSLGGATNGSAEATDPLCIAITNAAALGTLSVVAAGNDGRDAAGFSPARCDNALTVGAYDSAGKLASFTNYGADVDVNAPGVSIYSTTFDGAFGRKNGTSMASPHAAAVAALYAAAHPGSSAAAVAAGVIADSSDRPAPLKYSNKITSTKTKLDARDY